MISTTPRQYIRFGEHQNRHLADAKTSLPLLKPGIDEHTTGLISDLELASSDEKQDALVLSHKAQPPQITFQFPAHDGRKQGGKDTHTLNPDQVRVLQVILKHLALNNGQLLTSLADHPAFQSYNDDDSAHPASKPKSAVQSKGVNINFVNDPNGKTKLKRTESKDGAVTLNIYNNISQHNTQNAGQQPAGWLSTLAGAVGLGSGWGVMKLIGGTGAALGAYYLGPKVFSYASSKLVSSVLPENFAARASEMASVPLKWFEKGVTATATEVGTAATATPTLTQAAETIANATTTTASKVLPTFQAANVTLPGVSEVMGHAADMAGNIASKGFGLLNYTASLPLFSLVGTMLFNYVRHWTPAGRMAAVHHHHHDSPSGRTIGQVSGFKGNVHGFN